MIRVRIAHALYRLARRIDPTEPLSFTTADGTPFRDLQVTSIQRIDVDLDLEKLSSITPRLRDAYGRNLSHD